jgi:hypothetical protein
MRIIHAAGDQGQRSRRDRINLSSIRQQWNVDGADRADLRGSEEGLAERFCGRMISWLGCSHGIDHRMCLQTMTERLMTEKSITLHLFVISFSVSCESVWPSRSFRQRRPNCGIILPQNHSAIRL